MVLANRRPAVADHAENFIWQQPELWSFHDGTAWRELGGSSMWQEDTAGFNQRLAEFLRRRNLPEETATAIWQWCINTQEGQPSHEQFD